jgi:hypothetical protein
MRWTITRAIRSFGKVCAFVAFVASTPVSADQFSDTVSLFRQPGGRLCAGWMGPGNIAITAAHCVGAPAHFWIEHRKTKHHAYRIRIHPRYSPELIFFIDETNPDLAAILFFLEVPLQESREVMRSEDLNASLPFFLVRDGKRIDIPVSKIERNSGGFRISSDGKDLGFCDGDSGSPLYAEKDGKVFVTGILVMALMPSSEWTESTCGIEATAVDMDTVMKFSSGVSAR